MKLIGIARLEAVLATVGVLLLLASFRNFSEGWLFQHYPQLFLRAGSGPVRHASGTSTSDAPLSPSRAPAKPSGGVQLIGRLEIPNLRMSTLIVEGDDENSLRLGIGHVPGTAVGGHSGNTVLAGHRDTFFRDLRLLRIGDNVVFSAAGIRYRYAVVRMRIVPPTDIEVLKPSTSPRLTLITCYPFSFVGSAPKRLVVEARPVLMPSKESSGMSEKLSELHR